MGASDGRPQFLCVKKNGVILDAKLFGGHDAPRPLRVYLSM